MTLKNLDILESGDLLHCQRNTFLSKVIKYFSKSKKISHTAICIELYEEFFIIDSQWDGTRIRTFEQWQKQYNYDIIITRCNDTKDKKLLLKTVKPYLNVAYGYGDIFRHMFYSITGIWIKKEQEEKSLVCSEFIARVLGKKDAYKTNPYELYVYCLEKGHSLITHENGKY